MLILAVGVLGLCWLALTLVQDQEGQNTLNYLEENYPAITSIGLAVIGLSGMGFGVHNLRTSRTRGSGVLWAAVGGLLVAYAVIVANRHLSL
jgi:hypothetical protein